jgi:hypothetical protein
MPKMTERKRRKLLRKINKVWPTLSTNEKKEFEKDNKSDLNELYVDNYLNGKLYVESGNAGLLLNFKIQNPLSQRGEKYISISWIERLTKNPIYIIIVLFILGGLITLISLLADLKFLTE